jgi:hypothetical protein
VHAESISELEPKPAGIGPRSGLLAQIALTDRIQRLASVSGNEASDPNGVNVFAYEGMIACLIDPGRALTHTGR